MTIEEAIIQATLLKDGISKDKYQYEILSSLIDIAKKYQKIEQIVNSNPDYIHHTDKDTYKLQGGKRWE